MYISVSNEDDIFYFTYVISTDDSTFNQIIVPLGPVLSAEDTTSNFTFAIYWR